MSPGGSKISRPAEALGALEEAGLVSEAASCPAGPAVPRGLAAAAR
jgi:hypothetical protein